MARFHDDVFPEMREVTVADITATDLRITIFQQRGWRCWVVRPIELATGRQIAPQAQIIFNAQQQRAGIAEGGDAVWTDAIDARDAINRYYGICGAEISN